MSGLKPILIAGPTASGKSALALSLAKELNGVIINADSMQVYSELRILTARPSPEEEASVPHRLYGHVPAREAYSAGRYIQDAAAAITAAQEEGRRPVIVGGTGLYFKALLEGLSPIPIVQDSVRAHWRVMAAQHGAYALWQILSERDPATAFRLDPNDTQRIVRALEVLESSGKPLSYWQGQPGAALVREEDATRYLVKRDREALHARADARFDKMIEEGALDEVRSLASLQLDPTLPAMRALGVRPLLKFIEGEMDKAAAIAEAKAETRQYIKRQETWSRRYMIAWNEVIEK